MVNGPMNSLPLHYLRLSEGSLASFVTPDFEWLVGLSAAAGYSIPLTLLLAIRKGRLTSTDLVERY